MSFLKVSGLAKSYSVGGKQLPVICNLDLDVHHGEMVAVVGASGVGKSTLLHLLGGLDRAQSGLVQLGDISISELDDDAVVQFRNRNVGFVFQFHHLLPEFSALENVYLARLALNEDKEGAIEVSKKILKKVGLSNRLDHFPSELSGGENQRIAIARALINKPKIILADEPTGNLDYISAKNVFKILLNLKKSNRLIIFATHNREFAKLSDCKIEMIDGNIKSINGKIQSV